MMEDQMDRAHVEMDLQEEVEVERLRRMEGELLVDRMRSFNMMWHFFYGDPNETG